MEILDVLTSEAKEIQRVHASFVVLTTHFTELNVQPRERRVTSVVNKATLL